jgi:putative YhbY family RNA-binding protein
MDALSPTQRRALKAQAHALKPLVYLGGKGLTDAVAAEVERALAAHELIKVRVPDMDWDGRNVAMIELCRRCSAYPVQHIGKILVLYREKPVVEKKERVREKPAPAKGKPKYKAKGSARPGSRNVSRRRVSARPLRRPRTSRSEPGQSEN